jgi:carbohydrate kinase (thermoresistant glucokinase family)
MRAFVLMGVSGSGKSTVGAHAAARLAWPYLEGDDFHPAQNIEKMSRGEALTDSDRAPWIDALSRAINDQTASHLIIACSALTRFVRHRLEEAVRRPVSFIHLRASPHVLANRLAGRAHFMREDMLPSQLATLEEPSEAFDINADDAVDVVTARAIARMRILTGVLRPHP